MSKDYDERETVRMPQQRSSAPVDRRKAKKGARKMTYTHPSPDSLPELEPDAIEPLDD